MGPIVENALFWSDLNDLIVFFKRLSSIIGVAEKRNSTISSAFSSLLDFGLFLSDPETQGAFAGIVNRAYAKHFCRLNLGLMFAAYILDPNQKLKYVTDGSLRMGKKFKITILLDFKFDEDAANIMIKDEFPKYCRVLKNVSPKIGNIHDWWLKSNLIHLKIVAKRLAACHDSSANTERPWDKS